MEADHAAADPPSPTVAAVFIAMSTRPADATASAKTATKAKRSRDQPPLRPNRAPMGRQIPGGAGQGPCRDMAPSGCGCSDASCADRTGEQKPEPCVRESRVLLDVCGRHRPTSPEHAETDERPGRHDEGASHASTLARG